MRHIILIPTYNESENIVPLIKELLKQVGKNKVSVEILVVDDNSPDNTFQKAKAAFGKKQEVKLFLRTRKKGLASAILYGLKKATKEFVLVMDTDFNHNPKEIPIMLSLIQHYQLVIGSRFIGLGGMENKTRQHLSYLFNIYLKILLGHRINDNLSGFFIMRRKELLTLPIASIFTGFGEYFIRLIFTACKKKYSFIEVPVFYKNRIHGHSKSKFLEMFINYSWCGIHLRFTSLYE